MAKGDDNCSIKLVHSISGDVGGDNVKSSEGAGRGTGDDNAKSVHEISRASRFTRAAETWKRMMMPSQSVSEAGGGKGNDAKSVSEAGGGVGSGNVKSVLRAGGGADIDVKSVRKSGGGIRSHNIKSVSGAGGDAHDDDGDNFRVIPFK